MTLAGKNLTIIIVCSLIGYLYGLRTWRTQNSAVQKKKKQEIHEVIMFSDQGLVGNKESRNKVHFGLAKVIYYLNRSRHTVDVCMYVLTHPELYNILLKLNLRGVKVRVIVDAEMAYASKSYIHRLQKQCIAVRWMKSSNIMHHKFCLIDASEENDKVVPLLINGSMNWTKQAIHGNYENVSVTSQKELVEGYRKEFERLWILFKPIV